MSEATKQNDPEPAEAFVGRERELGKLKAVLEKALYGKPQICFLAGEAGSGKTALLEEFVRLAEDEHKDLVAAIGECNARTGQTEPYLPFREVLALLSGDVHAARSKRAFSTKSADRIKGTLHLAGAMLGEIGGELLGSIVPGASVLIKAAKVVAKQTDLKTKVDRAVDGPTTPQPPQLDQAKILQQYAGFLQAMSKVKPLLVAIDDLQWADSASLDLMFHIARKLDNCRVMLVGTYRPADVAHGRDGDRHPFESTLNELKRYMGEIVIEVEAGDATEQDRFVDSLVDVEPNVLSPEFRHKLRVRTNAHPLFTVELLRAMKDRGDLVKDRLGKWVEGTELDWDALPEKIEGVIEERISRLDQAERTLLSTASVEGMTFHSHTLSEVLKTSELDVLRALSQRLDQRHRIVHEDADARIGKRVLSRMRFGHVLIQQHLYRRLGSGERRLLHGEIAGVLERLYGERGPSIAQQLGWHLAAAGDSDRASSFFELAGRQALRVSALHEAAEVLQRALALLDDVDAEDKETRRAGVLVLIATVHERRGDYARAVELLDQALSTTRLYGLPGVAAAALSELSWIAVRQGRFADARSFGEEALAQAREAEDKSACALALRRLGVVARNLGEYDLAVQHYQASLALYRELKDQQGVIGCLNNLGNVAYHRKDFAAAERSYKDVLALARTNNYLQYVTLALSNLGEVARQQGNLAAASVFLDESVQIARKIGDHELATTSIWNLGDVMADRGEDDKAAALFCEALADAWSLGLIPRALTILCGLARLQARSGQAPRAAEWVGLALEHPLSNFDVRETAERVLAILRGGMPQPELDAAMRRGRELVLADVVSAALAARKAA